RPGAGGPTESATLPAPQQSTRTKRHIRAGSRTRLFRSYGFQIQILRLRIHRADLELVRSSSAISRSKRGSTQNRRALFANLYRVGFDSVPAIATTQLIDSTICNKAHIWHDCRFGATY